MGTQQEIDTGRLDGLVEQAPSPDGLGHSATIPSADLYSTIVLRHRDLETAKAFIEFAHKVWPFGGTDGPSIMTSISIGDTMSVVDAMRMALTCEELGPDERNELALDLEANCFTAAECFAFAESEWQLIPLDGQFVDAPQVSA